MYDPLHHATLNNEQPYPDSYWASTVNSPMTTHRLTTDITTDVAIIGGGYTGLSCALHLAKEHQVNTVVLEANQIAWGCSGRNAGFVLPSSGRKSYASMVKSWGDETMRLVYQEYQAGVDLVKSFIAQGIDCEQQPAGYLKMAHKPNKLAELNAQADLIKTMFNVDVERYSRNELHQKFVADEQAFGAIRFTNGFGINPLKLALGYAKLAQQAGADLYQNSPVVTWQKRQDGKHELITPNGRVVAKKVVIATNGYTPKNFHLAVSSRTLPVLSQIIVTSALSEAELTSCNFLTENVVMDTRALKYYYRKLPDNRILFGGRGAISGRTANDPFYADRLLSVLKQSFPSLSDIKIDYKWSGWICMALDDIPHIHQTDEQIYYAMGYCGSGVSFSAQAGKRLAEKIVGKKIASIPLYQTPLVKFPFAPLRRLGQWGYFQYGRVKDTYL